MTLEAIKTQMHAMGKAARQATHALSQAKPEQKVTALKAAAQALREKRAAILEANRVDVARAVERELSAALIDRLKLTDARIESMAAGLEAIAELDDPVGTVLSQWDRPNGLNISRVRVPLGVIGIIYESRPNVTADAGGLCLKSGNAAILRGGSDSLNSSAIIHQCLQQGLAEANLPAAAIQIVPVADRAAVGVMLKMSEYIDVIVPRGGKSLITRITEESTIPLFKHLEGLCHTYIDSAAKLDMALDVALNAKMRRTGICGATETILIHQDVLDSHLAPLIQTLLAAGCEVRADERIHALNAKTVAATQADWQTEYLDKIVSIHVVDSLDEAVQWINTYGSQHTDAIITEDEHSAQVFLNQVDSAICIHNASTQFADGGQFGMGAEIGISTGRLHARGPVGVEQLTTFKYLVRGSGQTRPK